jgi:predicted CXXCH cytochrome family protein
MHGHWHNKIRLLPTTALFLLWSMRTLAFDPAASVEVSMSQDSLYCTACHDGVLATEIHRGHTVDVNYLFAQLRSNGRLRPPAVIDPAIYFRDGQLVCVSCHHPESQQPSKLVLSNVGSGLCLACHNL